MSITVVAATARKIGSNSVYFSFFP